MYRLLLCFLLFLVWLLLVRTDAHAQNSRVSYSISGYVEDAETGEKLVGVNIYDVKSDQGATTNTYGFFSLTLPVDSVKLVISYVGYQTEAIKMYLAQDRELNISLQSSVTLNTVEVTGEAVERIEQSAQMSRISVPVQVIKKLPAFLGETDVLKIIQLLPGVQSGSEGQSGLYVRGGSPDQNLILLDGVPVYNASHLFGFFSVFNADAVRDVNLIKGGFPARFGGRLSSVLEINLKEGNSKEWHGAGSISTIASKIMVEGPIIPDKASILVSARRTYIDVLAKPFIKAQLASEGAKGDAGYFFHDFNIKGNYKFSHKDRLYLSAYAGRDKFYFRQTTEDPGETYTTRAGLGWGNITTALRWNHLFGRKLFSNTTLTFSRYDFRTQAEEDDRYTDNGEEYRDRYDLEYLSGIDDLGAKIDFDYLPNPRHTIRFGAGVTNHTFRPGDFDFRIDNSDDNTVIDTTFGNQKVYAPEFAAYVEDEFDLGERLKFNLGLHFSAFSVSKKFYTSLQPRASMRYLMPNGISLKGSFATMRQYIHLLSNEGVGLPTDLWVPTTTRIKPQDSWQAAIGAAKTIDGKYELSIEGYYKKMENVVAYREGSSLLNFGDWEDQITQGTGEAYGAELFLQKKKGRLTGWIGYTLAWATRQFDDINFGKTYPYKYDRRHDIAVAATYELSERIHLSGAWVYGTGNAVTLGNSRYDALLPNQYISGNFNQYEVQYYQDRNNYRMRAYHRFDVNVDFIKQKRRIKRTWSIGAYNLYSRQNPFFLYVDERYRNNPDGSGRVERKLTQVSLFPIIPSVAYKFEF